MLRAPDFFCLFGGGGYSNYKKISCTCITYISVKNYLVLLSFLLSFFLGGGGGGGQKGILPQKAQGGPGSKCAWAGLFKGILT